jgi:hypothetical protein
MSDRRAYEPGQRLRNLFTEALGRTACDAIGEIPGRFDPSATVAVGVFLYFVSA